MDDYREPATFGPAKHPLQALGGEMLDLGNTLLERDEMDDRISVEQLKVEINNFIHVHGPLDMTLKKADEVAIQILTLIRPDWQDDE